MYRSGLSDFDRLWIAAGKKAKEKQYWTEKLSGKLSTSRFPYSHFHKDVITENLYSHSVYLGFDEHISSQLVKWSANSDIRLHIILSAVLTLLLSKYTGNEDIIMGTPVSHGGHGETNEDAAVINTVLALRHQLNGEMPFKELLFQVRQTIIEADENQNYPFEVLVRQLETPFSEEGCPLFDVAVVLENIQNKEHLSAINPKVIFSFLRIEKHIEGKIIYNTHFYHRQMIERIALHFGHIVEIILSDPNRKISEIEVITENEKRQLLNDFNNTAAEYPKDKTIHELFEDQAEKTPDHIAVIGSISVRALRQLSLQISYRQLNERSEQLANKLIQENVQPDIIVGIKIGRSVEMIIGILGILKAGGAYLPIDPDYPQERIDYMVKDSGAALLVTTNHEEGEKLRSWEVKKVLFLDPLNLSASQPLNFSLNSVGADPCICPSTSLLPVIGNRPLATSLAYVIYTSGSTGSPKGVMVEHRNVIRLVKNTNFIDFQPEDRLLQTGALAFDASTFEIWGALLNGLSLHLMDKEDVLNPDKLKKRMIEHQITIMWMTSPFFNQMVQSNEEIFGPLRYLLVGGDVLSPSHIDRVRKRFPGLRVVNGYGPTENTTFSTTFLIDKDDEEKIPIGKPIANSTAYVVDRHGALQPVGIAGELWVGGDGVSRGYLNNPELTAQKFSSVPSVTSVAKNLYKTGDLCQWMEDGNIEFLGRIDQQVKIRGFRIELEEIEHRLLKHPAIQDAVIVVKHDKYKNKYLCAYIVSKDPCDPAQLREYLIKYLPDYMIPSHFGLIEKIPLTPNGKVDRKALPEIKVKTGPDYVGAGDTIEEKLSAIWSDVLEIEKNAIGIHDNFFNLGGHSLKAVRLISEIHNQLSVKLSLTEIFAFPTVKDLAGYIRGARRNEYAMIETVEEREYYDVAQAQERLWILDQVQTELTAYNIPGYVVFENLNRNALQQAFESLIKRHEILRTTFITVNGELKQKVHDFKNHDIRINYLDLRREEKRGAIVESLKEKEMSTPFNLEKGPLLRSTLLHVEDHRYIFLYTLHHIISDGWSMDILQTEFMTLYQAYCSGQENPLPPLRIQYKDYTYWQMKQLAGENLKNHEDYWLNRFNGDLPVLELPLDYPRSELRSFAGEFILFSLSKEMTGHLKRMCNELGTTLFIILLAMVKVFLYRYTGQTDIIVGTPVAGRDHKDLENQIGFYVNMLALRNQLTKGQSFRDVLEMVKRSTLEAFEHQVYPFDRLVHELKAVKDLSRHPLFDVVVILRNPMNAPEQVNLRTLPEANRDDEWVENGVEASKFDLGLGFTDQGDQIIAHFRYNAQLFKRERIMLIRERFIGLMTDIVSHLDKEIDDLMFTSEAEKGKPKNKFKGGF
ncbi:MAG: amino acid adenylation domain-containing protein [Candidatus Omnitrophota bacterium]